MIRALLAASLAFAVEYLARRFLAPWLPIVVSRVVSDLLVTALALFALMAAVVPTARRRPKRFFFGMISAARRPRAWLGALLAALATLGLARVDRAHFAAISLPGYGLPWRGPTLSPSATWLVPVAFLALNAVLIPIALEAVWRGVVQRGLARSLGYPVAIVLGAALFTARVALVDGTMARFTSMLAVGLVLGALCARWSWRTAAVAHAMMNLVAVAVSLLGLR